MWVSQAGPGAPGEVSPWRREPAAITRRVADANNHNSVVNKRQRCAGGGPEPRDKYAPRRGTEDRIKDA